MMFQKRDFILIAIIIVIAVVSSLLIAFAQRDAGAAVRIIIDGELYGEYSLSEEQSIAIDGELGHNRLVIEDGSAYMAGADCPDKYCMDYKPIAKGGETIICLPHKLVVEVTGTRDVQQPDVIVP
ncbi:MAG: NusG domain II-containing protein [Lachnospiraceae bacterium]|nr:NusG domain II-containing protein [Lachnospiraceae bacterium]MDE7200392.1 NusG domain II-containing protein [Lachnospiraceae bacterium]